jgi:hypothetical protein
MKLRGGAADQEGMSNRRSMSRLAWNLLAVLIALVLFRLVGILAVFWILLVWVVKAGLSLFPDEYD